MTISMVQAPGSLTIMTSRIGDRIEARFRIGERFRIGAGMSGLKRFE
jgi:hypothetical protein